MKRTLFVAAIAIGLATTARAATLTVDSDKSTYTVGETVTLTVTGNPGGAQAISIFGRLEYSPLLTSTVGSTQTRHTWGGGAHAAILGTLSFGDGFVDVFNQIIDFGETPRAVDQVQIATVTLIADAEGTVDVFWSTVFVVSLDFFGLVSQPAPATSFTIVPEPTSALLRAGCFAVLVAIRWGRRR